MDPYERIVWSADVADVPTLLDYLDRMPRLQWVKIDRAFFEKHFWHPYEALNRRGLKIFDDAKLIEVPHKLEELALHRCIEAQPTMMNCMAGGISNGRYKVKKAERDGLRRFSAVCKKHGVIPCAVSVLTSKTEKIVKKEFGGRLPVDQVIWYANQLVSAGFEAMVCSPLEAQAIKSVPDLEMLTLFTPGVRPAGAAAGTQARFTTPAQAISNGADHLVIGGPITDADDPATALDAIVAEIAALQPALV